MQISQKAAAPRLTKKLVEWIEEGDKLILVSDRNEDMKNGQQVRIMRYPDLDMKVTVK